MKSAIVTMLGAMAVLFAFAVPEAIGSVSMGSERIVFASHRAGSFDVYSMNADGGDPRQLTDSSFSDTEPAVSPDGSLIAFISSREGNFEIYVMASDGSNVVRLTNTPTNEFGPAWSPDGTMIAYTADPLGNNADVWIMNSDGTNQHNLTNAGGIDRNPDWSPDGTKIAFESVSGLATINLDGTGKTTIVPSQLGEFPSEPDWSPDGTRIAYSQDVGDDNTINAVGPNGEAPTELAGGPGQQLFSPSWSPDGTRMAYSQREQIDPDTRTDPTLYRMNADGSGQELIPGQLDYNTYPDWAFVATPLRQGDLDCNGSIGARDNQALLRHVLGQPSLSQTEPCPDIGDTHGDNIWGDLDCSGAIGARDNQALLRTVLDQPALSQTEPCPDIGET